MVLYSKTGSDCPMRGTLRHGETTLLEYSVTKAGSRDVLEYPAVYRINVIIYAACVAAWLPRDIGGIIILVIISTVIIIMVRSWFPFCLSPLLSRYFRVAHTIPVLSAISPPCSPRSRITRSSFCAEIELPEASSFVCP